LNLLQVYNHEKRKENFSLIIPTAIRLVQHFSAAFFLPFVLKFVRHETGHNFDYTFVCNSVWPTDSLSLSLSLLPFSLSFSYLCRFIFFPSFLFQKVSSFKYFYHFLIFFRSFLSPSFSTSHFLFLQFPIFLFLLFHFFHFVLIFSSR
jgi:hypothetical protein